MKANTSYGLLVAGAIAAALFVSTAYAGGTQAANPCAPKAANPCAAQNPCAAKNPCAAQNPCAASASNHIDAKLITRPKGTKLATGNQAALLKKGEELWNSKTLSSNGLACQTCHAANGAFQATFAKPYPHKVAMAAGRAGMKTITADEMVQLCMVAPMASKPLAWNSQDLAALTAYTKEVQKHYKPAAGAAPKNPCAANPCSPKM